MVERAFTVSHLPKFEHFLNDALRRDNEQEDELEGLSEMEKKRYLLANPQIKKRNLLNFKPLADLTVDKMATLNDYLITHCTTFNLESDFVATEKPKNNFFTGQQFDDEFSNDEDDEEKVVDGEGNLEANVHYSKTLKNRAEGHGILSKAYIDYDKDYCLRMNENPKMKNRLKKCPCGSNGYHEVIYGSLRYCPYFLQHPTLNGRREFLRAKRACFKCLRGNHNSSSCRYRPATCYYCKTAGKSDKSHSP